MWGCEEEEGGGGGGRGTPPGPMTGVGGGGGMVPGVEVEVMSAMAVEKGVVGSVASVERLF